MDMTDQSDPIEAAWRPEVKALRARIARLTQIDDERCKIVDELRAENARLTLDNQRLTEMWDADRESLTADLDRLRVQALTDREWIRGAHEELAKLRTAFEKLPDAW
jgi:hypothetical protein